MAYLNVFLLLVLIAMATSFRSTTRMRTPRHSYVQMSSVDEAACWKTAKPVHTEFKVTKATEEEMSTMAVTEWPTWTTEGSEKYKVGEKAPIKTYDTNELSYIISGSMEIYDVETGKATLVQAGDFVTFPFGYTCQWLVKETINKHWFCYKDDGSPDLD